MSASVQYERHGSRSHPWSGPPAIPNVSSASLSMLVKFPRRLQVRPPPPLGRLHGHRLNVSVAIPPFSYALTYQGTRVFHHEVTPSAGSLTCHLRAFFNTQARCPSRAALQAALELSYRRAALGPSVLQSHRASLVHGADQAKSGHRNLRDKREWRSIGNVIKTPESLPSWS